MSTWLLMVTAILIAAGAAYQIFDTSWYGHVATAMVLLILVILFFLFSSVIDTWILRSSIRLGSRDVMEVDNPTWGPDGTYDHYFKSQSGIDCVLGK
jgi:hypothetical protein